MSNALLYHRKLGVWACEGYRTGVGRRTGIWGLFGVWIIEEKRVQPVCLVPASESMVVPVTETENWDKIRFGGKLNFTLDMLSLTCYIVL